MFYFIYIAFIFFICITIYKLIYQKLLDEDLLFYLLVNYLLNITTALFFGFYNSLIWAFFSSLALIIFATILYFKIGKAFNKWQFFPLPYLFLTYFIFFFIFFNLL